MRYHTSRRRFLRGARAAGLLGVAGCAGDGTEPTTADTDGPPATAGGRAQTETATPDDAAAGEPLLAERPLYLQYSIAELREETSRGAGEDQIPSIDEPEFAPPETLTFPDEMLVFGAVRNGVARAYPQRILVYHEIVNDRIDGEPVAVTYCPLTGTVQGFDRGEATFGVSGLLINNNLVMYDRGTETLWPQIPATGIEGPLAGESLREFPLVWTSLGAWREAYPDTTVLTKSTGYARRYGQDPYGGGYDTHPLEPTGFYEREQTMFPKLVEPDDRLGPKDIVIGVRDEAGAVAFDRRALREATTLTGETDDVPYLAVYDADLDAGYVYRNPEERSFEAVDGEFRDRKGTQHAPDSLPLDRAMAFEAKWFAWYGYYSDTALVGG